MTTNGASSAAIDTVVESALAGGEVGFQIAAVHDGKVIADVAAGTTGTSEDHAVTDDTVFPVFSVSKAVTATAAHIQIERGLLDPDAPIATYWPEYAAAGKGAITMAHVLSHRAGVPFMPVGILPGDLADWDAMVERLAAATMDFPIGTNAYLSMTFGWIVGESVRRTDPLGRSFADFVQQEICEPLGMTFWFGVPDAEMHRVARLSSTTEPPCPPPDSPAGRAQPAQVDLVPDVYNRRDMLQACIPAVGGVSNAMSIARLFAMIANGGQLDGVRLLSPERVRSFLTPRGDADAPDRTFAAVMPVGTGGLWHGYSTILPAGHGAILCHPGAGGSIGWADLDTGIAGAVTHNRMMFGEPNPFVPLPAEFRRIIGRAE